MNSFHIDVSNVGCIKKAGYTPAFIIDKTSRMLYQAGVAQAQLSIVFLTAHQMKILNKKALHHAYVTDVITFDLSSKKNSSGQKNKQLIGEIYICPSMAEKNASFYGVSFQEEILRYIAHGLLHLMGLKDRTLKEQEKMRQQENILMGC